MKKRPAFLLLGVLVTALVIIFFQKTAVLRKIVILDFDPKKSTYKFITSEKKVSKLEKTVKNSLDLDKDGFNEEYILSNRTLTVWQNKKNIWQTPVEWRVNNFIPADSDNDGVIEINLSVWKPGNFGSSKPFWIKENDQSIKNHFFVFKLEKGKVRPIWQSSNLDSPNCDFIFNDINSDKRQELIVIEGEYRNPYACLGEYVAVWQWNGWGFSNLWRSVKGNYRSLDISKVNGENKVRVTQ